MLRICLQAVFVQLRDAMNGDVEGTSSAQADVKDIGSVRFCFDKAGEAQPKLTCVPACCVP